VFALPRPKMAAFSARLQKHVFVEDALIDFQIECYRLVVYSLFLDELILGGLLLLGELNIVKYNFSSLS
jgi:hypothetical protein